MDAESKGPGGFVPTSFGEFQAGESRAILTEERKTRLQEGTDVFGAQA